jgi:DNA-binding NarL/FixJ family response regulator
MSGVPPTFHFGGQATPDTTERVKRGAIAMTRIFIVDDHVLIREGLRKILYTESDLTIVGEAQCGNEALDRLDKCKCDVLILDIALPDKSGLEVLKEVKTRYPKLDVIILSIYPEERYAIRALIDGAVGYVTKNSAADELILAIRTVIAGKKFISPALTQELVDHLQLDQKQPAHEKLSDREYQILLLIGSGKTVSQIAMELNLGVSTVNTHRLHILKKMNLRTNIELVRYVLENHLIE